MLAKYEAKSLISSASYEWIDNLLTVIPEELKPDTNKTIVLVSEAATQPTGYGNNVFNEIENTVEVQVFYSDEFQFDSESCEIQLMKLFQANNWRITDSKAHSYDPDTNQITKTFEFTKTKQI